MEITLDEIRENAKVICNFLELRIVDKRAKKNPTYHIPFSNIPDLEYYPGCDDPYIEMETDIIATATKFHKSMDWMLPVVEKIESILNEREERIIEVYINARSCTIAKVDGLHLAHGHGRNMTMGVYNACVKFIKENENFLKHTDAKVNYDTSF
jgi:hypothetical protein